MNEVLVGLHFTLFGIVQKGESLRIKTKPEINEMERPPSHQQLTHKYHGKLKSKGEFGRFLIHKWNVKQTNLCG